MANHTISAHGSTWPRSFACGLAIIKNAFSQIAPAELEKEIAKVPGVEQCCVVGKPHPEEGDLALALVEKQPGAIVTAQQVKDIVAGT